MSVTLSALRTTEIDRASRIKVRAPMVRASVNRRPDFAFTEVDGRPDEWVPGGWAAGRWPNAESPIIGQVVNLSAGLYDVWVRTSDGQETTVGKVGRLRVR